MSAERKVSISPTIRYGLAILVSSYILKKNSTCSSMKHNGFVISLTDYFYSLFV